MELVDEVDGLVYKVGDQRSGLGDGIVGWGQMLRREKRGVSVGSESVWDLRDWRGNVSPANGGNLVEKGFVEPVCEVLRVAPAVDEERTLALPAQKREDHRIRGAGDAKETGETNSEGVPRAVAALLQRNVLRAGVEGCTRQGLWNWCEIPIS